MILIPYPPISHFSHGFCVSPIKLKNELGRALRESQKKCKSLQSFSSEDLSYVASDRVTWPTMSIWKSEEKKLKKKCNGWKEASWKCCSGLSGKVFQDYQSKFEIGRANHCHPQFVYSIFISFINSNDYIYNSGSDQKYCSKSLSSPTWK